VVKNDFLLRISLVGLQLRWSPRKNPQRISEDTPPAFSQSPPRFVSTIKMLTTEPFFTTLLVSLGAYLSPSVAVDMSGTLRSNP
jgi:hypothetical protein